MLPQSRGIRTCLQALLHCARRLTICSRTWLPACAPESLHSHTGLPAAATLPTAIGESLKVAQACHLPEWASVSAGLYQPENG